MSYYECFGKITFENEAEAEKARRIFDRMCGLKRVGDRLYWTDDVGAVVGDDQFTPAAGTVVYLNGGILSRIMEALWTVLHECDVRGDETYVRFVTTDGDWRAGETVGYEIRFFDTDEMSGLTGFDYERVAELDEEDPRFLEILAEEEEKLFDWVTEGGAK